MVGLIMSTFFKTACPTQRFSQETADEVVEILKNAASTRRPRSRIFHEMLRHRDQGPARRTATAGGSHGAMAECKETLYTKERLDVPEGEGVAPSPRLRTKHIYRLYLRHLVITVGPYLRPSSRSCIPTRWWDTHAPPEFCVAATSIPTEILRIRLRSTCRRPASPTSRPARRSSRNPCPSSRDSTSSSRSSPPFRTTRSFQMSCRRRYRPRRFYASIAIFCSRPDAAKIYRPIRIAALHGELSRDQLSRATGLLPGARAST